jgi:hypothetical protein
MPEVCANAFWQDFPCLHGRHDEAHPRSSGAIPHTSSERLRFSLTPWSIAKLESAASQ